MSVDYDIIIFGNGLAGEHGSTSGLGDETLDLRVGFLEGGGATGKRSPGADKIHKGVDGTARLADNFRAGVQVVGPGIALQAELIGAKGPALLDDFLRPLLDCLQIAAGDLARHRSG